MVPGGCQEGVVAGGGRRRDASGADGLGVHVKYVARNGLIWGESRDVRICVCVTVAEMSGRLQRSCDLRVYTHA